MAKLPGCSKHYCMLPFKYFKLEAKETTWYEDNEAHKPGATLKEPNRCESVKAAAYGPRTAKLQTKTIKRQYSRLLVSEQK